MSRQCLSPGPTLRENNVSGRASQRRRGLRNDDPYLTETSLTPNSPSAPSHDGSNYHAIQAKSVIQIDLHNPYYICRERQLLLRSALQLVNRIAASGPGHSTAGIEEEPQLQDSALTLPETPSHELLLMLLPGTDMSLGF